MESLSNNVSFVQEVKALFKKQKLVVNLAAENAEMKSLRETRKIYASCDDDLLQSILRFPSRKAALDHVDLEILKLRFKINAKLHSCSSKIDKVLYWFFVNDKLDQLDLFKHPVTRNNLPYCQFRVKQFLAIRKKYCKKTHDISEQYLYNQEMNARKYSKKQKSFVPTKQYYTRVPLSSVSSSINRFEVLENIELPEPQQDSIIEDDPMYRFHAALFRNGQEISVQLGRHRLDYSNVSYDVQRPYQPTVIPRPVDLWGRLRERLAALRELRLPTVFSPFKMFKNWFMPRDNYFEAWIKFHIKEGHQEYEMFVIDPCVEALPEMDTADAHGEGTLQTSQASNVVLTENREDSREVTADFQVTTWKDLCSSEFAANYDVNVDRWILINLFEWTTASTQGALLKSYYLPLHMVKKEVVTPCRMPNTLPFTIHRYWRGDLEIKIHINANKFQIGSLQCSWYYSPNLDAKIDKRLNLWTQSQAHHVIINASTSNEVTMVVPYKYHLPYLHTKPRGDMPSPPLNLGTLYIRVLNPLTTSVNGPTRANVSVFVRSFNNEFTGMLSGDIDKIEDMPYPEMDRILDVTAGVLNMLHPDNNRDNPPNPRPPQMLVPTASHSWSVGTGMAEPIHPLRLDGRGQTPHPPGIEVNNEMEIRTISRVFGLLETITWTNNHLQQQVIWSADASPFPRKNCHYTQPESDTSLGTYAIPPVGVLSSMFYGWRGTIEFRFDVVASQFHTGRLIIAYIPGVTSTTPISFAQLRASTNMVFSLQETDQFTFKVPFICNKPYWPREFAGDYDRQNSAAPSRIYIAVLNQLIPMESVSNQVYINVYMRAGDDFELIVPVQPSIGLPYNTKYLVTNNIKTQIVALSGYYPYYSGTFEDFTEAQVFRWGTAAHQIAHFDDYNHSDTVRATICTTTDTSLKYTDDKGTQQTITWAVFFNLPQLGYFVGIPCRSQAAATQLAINCQLKKKALNDPENTPYVLSNKWSTSSNTYCTGNPVWTVYAVQPNTLAYAEGERGQAADLINIGSVASTMQGLSIYGENFFSLKDLSRRYQLYGVYNVTTFTTSTQEYVKIRFPAVPQGLALNIGTSANINEIFNRCREGHIPIIASGYRFYRGSIRFRLICDPKIASMIVVQHRPDRRLRYLNIQSQDKTDIDGDSVMNHTYASYIQLTRINGVIEFEVPYYQLGMYGLLQYPNVNEASDVGNYYSLGEIAVSMTMNTADIKSFKNSLLSIYYCMADDMSFSTFQGFPPMILTSELPLGTLPSTLEDFILPEMEYANPEGLLDGVKNGVRSIVSESVQTTVKQAISEEMAKLDPYKKQILEKLEVNVNESIFKIVIECLHLSQSRSIQTICLVVIQVLLELKFIIVDNILGIGQVLVRAVTNWLSRTSGEVIEDVADVPVVSPEALYTNFEVKDWGPFVGMLFTGVTTALSLAVAPPKSFDTFSKFLSKQIPTVAKNFVFISTFVNSIVDLAKRMIRWIMHKVYPQEAWYIDMRDDAGELKDWVDEVLYLCSLDMDTRLDEDGYLYDRVYACLLYGREMAARYCGNSDPKIHLFMKVYDKINDLYWKMTAAGRHPFVRKEPFCIWMYGQPGIGKSFLTEHISSQLLQHIKYKMVGPKIFTVMPACEFWTGCKNQPVLCMDDAFSVSTGNTMERQLNTMYMVKSPVTLNPPMADLKDKHLRYNPEIFYINSNIAFLNVPGLDAAAIHRRRDILIEAAIRDEGKQPRDYPREVVKVFGHLKFRTHKDPRVPSTEDNMWSEWMSYEELITIMKTQYRTFYDQEKENYDDRLATYHVIEDGQSEDQQRDDNNHIYSIGEISRNRHQRAIDEYTRAYNECLYVKMRGSFERMYEWMSDLNMCQRIANYVNPMIVRVNTIANAGVPEMDLEDEQPCGISTLSASYPELRPHPVNSQSSSSTGRRSSTHGSYSVNSSQPKSFREMQDTVSSEDQYFSIAPPKFTTYFSDFKDGELIVNETQENRLHIFETSLECILKDRKIGQKDIDEILKYVQRGFGDIVLSEKENLGIFYHTRRAAERNPREFWRRPWNFWKCVYYGLKMGDTSGTQAIYTLREDWRDCVHMVSVDTPKNMSYDLFKEEGHHNWYMNGIKVPHCRGGKCIMDAPFFKALWHWAWLNNHTDQLWQYRKNELRYLPAFFNFDPSGRELKKELDDYFKSFTGRIVMWCKNTLGPMAVKVLKYVAVAGVCVGVACSMMWGIKTLARLFGFNICDDAAVLLTAAATPKLHLKAGDFCIAEGAYNIPSKIVKRPDVKVMSKMPEMAPQQYSNIMAAINRNTVIITAEYFNEKGSLCSMKARALGLEANRVIMIRHYHDEFTAMPPSTRYYVSLVTNNQLRPRVEINYRECRCDAFYCKDPKYGTNFFMLYMPPHIPLFRNIKNLIPTAESHQYCGRLGHLYAFGDATYADLAFNFEGEYRIQQWGNAPGMVCMNAYTYSKHKPGLCGSVLISEGLPSTPLIGMHVAGANGKGYAEPLFREMFDMLSPLEIVDVAPLDVAEAKPEVSLETVVFEEGTCHPKMKHVETGKTAYIPSEIAGVFPITYEPNPLSPKDPRLPKGSNPIKDGCEKHGMPVRPFPARMLERASYDLVQKFKACVVPVRAKVGVLSEQDAICGNVNVPHFESLEWNSSPGYGYADLKRSLGNPSGKKFLFDLDETPDGYVLKGKHDRLTQIMNEKHEQRKKGIVPATVFVDCLKDTTIPKEKCSVRGKTRIFSISPVDFTIQFKQYCGDFLAAYTKARFRAEHAIGINVDSEEWTGLYNHVVTKGYNFITGDYSNFGPGLSLEVANAAFEIIVEWYRYHGASEEHLRILRVMKCEILCARHLCLNVFYSVCCGIPSGSPITTPLNSIVNSLYLRVMWMRMFNNHPDYFSLESFNAHVNIVTYGDDVIGCVSDEVRDLYNIASLSENFADFNITFTDARKTGVIVPYITDIREVWFLSRCFIPHPTRPMIWLAGLKKDSIQNAANWIKKKFCKRDSSLINSRMAIELSFGWGPEYYREVCETVRKAWVAKNEVLYVKTWEERDKEIFDFKCESSISFFPVIEF
nr:polyprotein [Tribolium castaneum iflavirus]